MSTPFNPRQEQGTVLVVDADDEARGKLTRALNRVGFRVLDAADAPHALRLMHREPCDLVLIDIDLPGVDGLAMCRLLRAREVSTGATRRIPVLIVSEIQSEERRVAALESGANDFLIKDISARELLTRVRAHLESAERERRLAGSTREFGFLADLGRGLLHTLEPVQVVRQVAGATFEGVNAALCLAAVLAEAEPDTPLVGCVFDREGSAEDFRTGAGFPVDAEMLTDDSGTFAKQGILVNRKRLAQWIAVGPPSPTRLDNREHFILRDDRHALEYIAPLRFGDATVGALIVAFDRTEECGEAEESLIDHAAQMAALAAHIAALYAAARLSSVELARVVERRTADAERQRRLLEAIVDSLPVSLYAIDRDYQIVAWNRNRELGGQGIPRGSALGRNIFDVLTRQPRELLESEFMRVFENAELERIEQTSIDASGKTRHWLVSKIPMHAGEGEEVSHVITLGEDITARIDANRAVARAEKLAAVGRLAAGVVHEINNPLATIAACAEALESRVNEGGFDKADKQDVDDLREYLALIRSEAFRCKSITNGLLDFSRGRAGEYTKVNLLRVIESTARLIMHQQRGAGIKIETDVPGDLPSVMGDEGQLQQAIIALATNAIDAMPDGGTLTVRARARAKGVSVEVRDTGIGIAPENLQKIFEPFFTTKEIGQGTGLGLAVCYGIVEEHGGAFSVESVVGRGTIFTITLPAIPSQQVTHP